MMKLFARAQGTLLTERFAKTAGLLPLALSYSVSVVALLVFRSPEQRNLWITTYTIPAVLSGPFNFFLIELNRSRSSVGGQGRILSAVAITYAICAALLVYFFALRQSVSSFPIMVTCVGFSLSFLAVPYLVFLWKGSLFWTAALSQSTLFFAQLVVLLMLSSLPSDWAIAIATLLAGAAYAGVTRRLYFQRSHEASPAEPAFKKPLSLKRAINALANPGTLTLDRLIFDQMAVTSVHSRNLAPIFYIGSRVISGGFSVALAILLPSSLSSTSRESRSAFYNTFVTSALLATVILIAQGVVLFFGRSGGTDTDLVSTVSLCFAFAMTAYVAGVMTRFHEHSRIRNSLFFMILLCFWLTDLGGKTFFYLRADLRSYSKWTFCFSLLELLWTGVAAKMLSNTLTQSRTAISS